MRQKILILNNQVSYVELGQRPEPCFVLVHGIGVSSRYFIPLAQQLAKIGKVYVLDLPGHGHSPKPLKVMSITDYGTVLGEFIAQLKLSNPVLVGHSMGCQVITDLVVRQPLVSDHIVLIGPTVYPKERKGFLQALRLVQDGFHEPWKVNITALGDYARCGLRWYRAVLKQMLSDRIEERLDRVKAQTLVIRGGADVIVPESWAQTVADRIPNGILHTIAGNGHVVMYKFAKEVADDCIKLANR